MKAAKYILLTFFFILMVLPGTACSDKSDSEIRKAVSAELDPLKGLSPDEAYSYLTQAGLFDDPDWFTGTSAAEQVKDVFSMFFKDFNFEYKSAEVSENGQSANASVVLKTIDAESLAKDFASSALRESVEHTASGSSTSMNAEDRFLLLNHLLKTREYKFIESDRTIPLTKNDGKWTVKHTSSLENQLVGGLVTCLSDPFILTPSETLDITLNTVRKMSTADLSNYLGITELKSQADDAMRKIYDATAEQVHDHFDYEILESNADGNTASVNTRITSFDSDSIMENYHSQMDQYLATADAVIDGADVRLKYSEDLLLKCITENTSVKDTEITVDMTNDGFNWKITNPEDIGEALFGSIQIEDDYSEE